MKPPISRSVFLEIIAEVGECLSGIWEIIPNPEGWPMGARLADPDLHASLYLSSREGKIHVSTDLPKDAKGEIPYVPGYGQIGKRMPSINVSFDKTTEQIAKDIERRLMPEYMGILAKALTIIDSSDAFHGKTEGVEAKGNKVDFYRSRHPLLHETIGRAEVHDDEVELELRLPYDVTLEVLKFLISLR